MRAVGSKWIDFYKVTPIPYDEIAPKIRTVVSSGIMSNGDNVDELEIKLAEIQGVEACVCFGSGTAALQALMSTMPTRDIAVQGFADQAMRHAVRMLPQAGIKSGGINFAPVDIDPKTWNADHNHGKELVDTFIYTSTFGSVPGMPPDEGYVCKYLLDHAHGIGVPPKQSWDAHILSFSPSKIITGGEGGAVLTDDMQLWSALDEGLTRNYGRMQEISAIQILWRLKHLKKTLARRREIAENYMDALRPLEKRGDIAFQEIPIATNWSRFAVRCLKATGHAVGMDLAAENVETRRYYQPITDGVQESQKLFNQIVVLPSYDSVDEHKVAKKVRKVF